MKLLPFNGKSMPQGVLVHVTRFRDGKEYYGVTDKVYKAKTTNTMLLTIKTRRGNYATFREGEVLVSYVR